MSGSEARQRLIARRAGSCLLLLVLIAAESGSAQIGRSVSAPAPAQPEVPRDALGRNTPRGTVQGFLTSAAKGDNETATQYLDTRLRGQAAVVLARQLSVVLNRRLPARLNEISDKPEGSPYSTTEPAKDLIGTIHSETGDVEILVERVATGNAGARWLFSRQTLDEIPGLYEEINSEHAENGLTKFLVQTRIGRIALINWLALFVCLPLLYWLMVRLNPILSHIGGRLLRRLRKNPHLPDPEILSMPARFILLGVVIRWAGSAIALPLLARQFWSSIATMAFIVGALWFVIRLNRLAEDKIRLRLGRRNLSGAVSILRFVRSATDILVIFVGLLIVLYYFGIDATTALAGLGVGGIAVALAAQKTLENIIAGVSLICDQAIRVGDFLKVGATSGTVTDIGLRSTRIRALDRSIVNVPNGQIANATLENLSLRDQFWLHHVLRLTYETTTTQLRSIIAEVTKLLLQSSRVEQSSARARFLGFGESSLDIEIFAYVVARDWPDFLKAQEDLLLEMMDLVEAAGARIALPSRMTYITPSGPKETSTLKPVHNPINEESQVNLSSEEVSPIPSADSTRGYRETAESGIYSKIANPQDNLNHRNEDLITPRETEQ